MSFDFRTPLYLQNALGKVYLNGLLLTTVYIPTNFTIKNHVYNFKNGKIEQDYVNANNPIVCKQLVKAGLRLATILNKIFDSQI